MQTRKKVPSQNIRHLAKYCKTEVTSNPLTVNQVRDKVNVSNNDGENEVYMFCRKQYKTYPIKIDKHQ